jgi:hypothetical protein
MDFITEMHPDNQQGEALSFIEERNQEILAF